MPAPVRVYGQRLEDAVARGDVTEQTVDGLVRDLIGVMNLTRADELSCDEPEESIDDPAERALTRRAAVAGTVLLRNEPIGSDDRPVLPVDVSAIRSVAVIGPNAVVDRSMGGGSASLTPFGHRTLLDALRDRFASIDPSIEVSYQPGVRIDRLTPVATRSQLRTSDGTPGLRVEYVNGTDWNGPCVHDAVSTSSMVRFFGTTPDEVDPLSFSARVTGSFIPTRSGTHTFGLVSTGPVVANATIAGTSHMLVDDPNCELPRTREFFGYGSEESTLDLELEAGVAVELDVSWSTGNGMGFSALRIGVREPDPADLFEQAIAAASKADLAVVVVGTNDEWETEGFDRETMDLPGRQDQLVEQIVAANPNTAVVVNAGSPVTMDWASPDHASAAPAILTSYFAGQEQAEAMVDVLLGNVDPGGRLPITYPVRYEDHPAFDFHEPDRTGDGPPVQTYREGLFIGHRHYERAGIAPRFWFGHGLSFGQSTWGAPSLSTVASTVAGLDTDPITLTVPVTHVAGPATTVVVQCYVMPIAPTVERPARELKAWAKAVLTDGERRDLTLELGPDAFHHWDDTTGGWAVAPGDYDLVLATSSDPAAEVSRTRISLT
jgi:beta-glucosidase